jgi:hypothetical protein
MRPIIVSLLKFFAHGKKRFVRITDRTEQFAAIPRAVTRSDEAPLQEIMYGFSVERICRV